MLYVLCCLSLLFLLALPVARVAPLNPIQLRREVDHGDAAEDARLSCGSGIRRPPPHSSPCPVGIKPLGADARRGPLTPSTGVTSMLLRNPHGHLRSAALESAAAAPQPDLRAATGAPRYPPFIPRTWLCMSRAGSPRRGRGAGREPAPAALAQGDADCGGTGSPS